MENYDIPPVQVALDLLDLPRAIEIAKEAVLGGVTWIEAGTPLIKSEGMNAIRKLRENFPNLTIVADMKTMDAGSTEVEMAAKAGADVILILGVGPDSMIKEAVLAGKKYGVLVGTDLIATYDPVERAYELEKLGVDIINIHVGLDQQVLNIDPVELVKKVSERCKHAKIAAAGGLNSETAVKAYEAGADIIIVGGPLYKSESPEKTARDIITSLKTGKPISTSKFKKFNEKELLDAFKIVSTSNISDAMHRTGEMRGLKPVVDFKKPLKFAGPAVTVRTYAGDWSKPVSAIDVCSAGDVLVIDNCGSEISCWGGLATLSCKTKGIVAVIVDGAVRDVEEILKIGIPVFSKSITPTAGEPKGFGEINSAILCAGRTVEPGDWIIGDENGIIVVPKKDAMEIANRAIDVKEREDRVKEEINRGNTLGKVIRLKDWELKK
ncbi:Orotidine 5'-phosphate decarboxylase [Methanococcus vannielii SB]|jgi:3-hexulose-6-phosphate synthase/6-phospho-3-hexuloisomerase|uniref:3-hexulose-6-phosphate synthase n=1 Tax=Methanococcus vannielii (strain ATCC 35089 / DSM 1224 / JCM 13029 / OCM 148 / SB) TaxID=406327 RepID=A6UPR7_METVS|nr:3-hexulose-6-phosphate synthase [Methanococcus vannielii]ABR54489.1 Orotidine 5'-phosphate decarboxylase [Methanococcus vannielii SB]